MLFWYLRALKLGASFRHPPFAQRAPSSRLGDAAAEHAQSLLAYRKHLCDQSFNNLLRHPDRHVVDPHHCALAAFFRQVARRAATSDCFPPAYRRDCDPRDAEGRPETTE